MKYVIPNKFTNKTINSYLPDLDKVDELSDFENEEILFCRKQFSWEEEIYGGQQ